MTSDGKDSGSLQGFQLDRVLSEDPKTHAAALLGHFSAIIDGKDSKEQAIVLVEKTHFEQRFYAGLGNAELKDAVETGAPEERATKVAKTVDSPKGAAAVSTLSFHRNAFALERTQSLGQNDIYTWLLGWTASESTSPADIKITLIRPASEAHVAKHSSQPIYVVTETPEMYKENVEPWILAQPPSRIQWVYNILEKKKEKDSILYENPDPHTGFVILPDLKWDQKTLSSLHLTAIVHDRSLRSLRDLRPESEEPRHVELLRAIRAAGAHVASVRFGLRALTRLKGDDTEHEMGGSALRCYLHYHPTYYHLHVHITAADNALQPGALVGKAHLVDDVIDLLQLGVDLRRRSIGVALGAGNELWDVLYGVRA
ncbi:HIT-like protein [Tilletiaria anomala UBC 951]|uniref:HIT-like protein n=1 Tax=Tilletiaria anomala (strain ATCC 24038 / CBS 436.72 / UBC 951) TaxID=1037660 RepID=A0A066WM21_TILAU|nr:HIT-like protein [Tilletiaria anomala UBC 951]KDN52049.1 HIT-like protein [Tilletiaria anomala UBC 951]